jgi:uncharacterized integral membrane protein
MVDPLSEPTESSTVREYRGTGVFWVLVGVFVPLVLLIVMLAQNAEPVTLEFLWWDLHPPLYVLLLVTAAAAAALTESLAAAWRHQRRRARTERSELAALRAKGATGGTT